MSTNNKTPPDPDGLTKTSTEKIETAAQEAIRTAMEDGAGLEEACTWLALNLARITIQLHPNSNQLDPEQMEDLANKASNTKGNRKTSESLEKVLKNAKNRYIEVYTTIEDVLRKVSTNEPPEEGYKNQTTKAVRGSMSMELWDKITNLHNSIVDFDNAIKTEQ